MARELGLDASGAKVAATAAQGGSHAHGPCMGAEKAGVELVGLREHRLGAIGITRMGGACVKEQAGSRGACGRIVRAHLDGIPYAVALGATNVATDSMNPRIWRIKAMACEYRNRERFRNAILCHFGGLNLYPRPVSAHKIS